MTPAACLGTADQIFLLEGTPSLHVGAPGLRRPRYSAYLAAMERSESLPQGFCTLASLAPGAAQGRAAVPCCLPPNQGARGCTTPTNGTRAPVDGVLPYGDRLNFTGAAVPGYFADSACVLRCGAAAALGRVQARLEARGLSLRVLDCYRPQTAVDGFWRWAQGGDVSGGEHTGLTRLLRRSNFHDCGELRRAEIKGHGAARIARRLARRAADARAEERLWEHYMPRVPSREQLFQRGYVARRSGHSIGNTVDLTVETLAPAGSAEARAADPVHAWGLDPSARAGRRALARDAVDVRAFLGPPKQRRDALNRLVAALPCYAATPEQRMCGFAAAHAMSRRDASAVRKHSSRELDFGTTFDCFDATAHTSNGQTREARIRRQWFVEVMASEGFASRTFRYACLNTARQAHTVVRRCYRRSAHRMVALHLDERRRNRPKSAQISRSTGEWRTVAGSSTVGTKQCFRARASNHAAVGARHSLSCLRR